MADSLILGHLSSILSWKLIKLKQAISDYGTILSNLSSFIKFDMVRECICSSTYPHAVDSTSTYTFTGFVLNVLS